VGSTDLVMSVKTLPATSVNEVAQSLLRVAKDSSLENTSDYVAASRAVESPKSGNRITVVYKVLVLAKARGPTK
jgi:hypothetical protein